MSDNVAVSLAKEGERLPMGLGMCRSSEKLLILSLYFSFSRLVSLRHSFDFRAGACSLSVALAVVQVLAMSLLYTQFGVSQV